MQAGTQHADQRQRYTDGQLDVITDCARLFDRFVFTLRILFWLHSEFVHSDGILCMVTSRTGKWTSAGNFLWLKWLKFVTIESVCSPSCWLLWVLCLCCLVLQAVTWRSEKPNIFCTSRIYLVTALWIKNMCVRRYIHGSVDNRIEKWHAIYVAQ